MAKAERFEDLIARQQARVLRKEVYAASKNGSFLNDLEMRAQIRDTALPAMHNLAEGFERGSNQEFARFLKIANGPAGDSLFVSRICSGLITYLQNATHAKTCKPDNLKT